MASTLSQIRGSMHVENTLSAGTMVLADNSVTNDKVASTSPIDAEKLEHQHVLRYAQEAVHHRLAFTSGGTHEILVGDQLTGGTSSATCEVVGIIFPEASPGTWAGGDAAGTLLIRAQKGTFESEVLNEGANSNVCTIAADSIVKEVVSATHLLHIASAVGEVLRVEVTSPTMPTGSDTVTVQIQRVRAGSAQDVLSSVITLSSADSDWDIEEGTINGSYDDLVADDVLQVVVVATSTTTQAEGLLVTIHIREQAD